MSGRVPRIVVTVGLAVTLLLVGSARPSAAGPPFKDLDGTVAYDAVTHLAALGIVKGCDPPTYDYFCPNDPTLREQMAALIVRAVPGWSYEYLFYPFTDPTDDAELMHRVATLEAHGVVVGYPAATCQGLHKVPPCYGPLDNVAYGQAILFVTRMMVAGGYWRLSTDDRSLYPDQNGPAGADPDTDQQTLDHRMLVTFEANAGTPRDVWSNRDTPFQIRPWPTQTPIQYWGDPAPRAWFARLLWQALQTYNNGVLPYPIPSSTPSPSPSPSPSSSPSSSPIPSPSPSAQPSPSARPNCDPSYPTVCIPPPPPDLNCSDIPYRNFTVLPPDPHNFDADGDGIGCEQ